MNTTISEIFPMTSDEDVESIIDLHNAVWDEMLAHRVPTSTEEFRVRRDYPNHSYRFFAAKGDTGVVLGVLTILHFNDGTNPHFQFVQIFVDKDHRRQGIGSDLLRTARDIAVETGRNTMNLDAFERAPSGDAFCLAIGADVGMREHINLVDVADLDRSMLELWIAEGPSRAPGYEMLVFEDGYSDEFYGQVAGLWHMADEDMPFEDLDMEPTTTSAEDVAHILDRGKDMLERLTAMPRHIESGELVGFSELLRLNSDHATLQTTLTMVHRDHRGYALGKWVKAAVILRAIDRWPEAVRIRTENAKSNDAMLGINDAIGFEPRDSMVSYQMTVDTVDRYLDSR